MLSTISVWGKQVSACREIDNLGKSSHTLIALSLLSELGEVDSIFVAHFGGVCGLEVSNNRLAKEMIQTAFSVA